MSIMERTETKDHTHLSLVLGLTFGLVDLIIFGTRISGSTRKTDPK